MIHIENGDGDVDEMLINYLAGWNARVNGSDLAIKGYTRREDGVGCLLGVEIDDEGTEMLERGVRTVPLDDINIYIY